MKQSILWHVRSKMTLRNVILIPVLILLIVGGGISHLLVSNFAKAYNMELVATNQVRIKNHLDDYLKDYFEVPEKINAINADLAAKGELKIDNVQSLGAVLLSEVAINTAIDYAYYANEDGGIVSVGSVDGAYTMAYTEGLREGTFNVYALEDGEEVLLKSIEDFDPRQKDWYKEVTPKGHYWTQVYGGVQEDVLGISTAYGLYTPEGEKIGVFGADILLGQMADFLSELKATPNTVICLVDEAGYIISATPGVELFDETAKGLVRVKAKESLNPVVATGMARLGVEATKGNFEEEAEGEPYVYYVDDFIHGAHVHWKVLVAFPKRDLAGELQRLSNILERVLVAGTILLMVLYMFIASWIVRPIVTLKKKVGEVANQEWGMQIETSRSDELGELIQSFNVMSTKLKHSIDLSSHRQTKLEALNANLEEIVSQRTKKLEKLSNTDSLTGLYNKRYLMEKLLEQAALAEQYGVKFSVVLFDVDHFKRINDTFGHLEGDRVLSEISAYLFGSVRESDTVGRFGGEEFMIVMGHTGIEEATIAAQRYRTAISDMIFGERKIELTISGGVAEYREDESLEALVDRADSRLYMAKKQGRNRVIAGE